MKRALTSVVIVGYLLLVPYCFLGTPAFLTSTHSASEHVATAHAGGHLITTCGDTCLNSPASDTLLHHMGMYLSITSGIGVSYFMIFALLFLLALTTVVFRIRNSAHTRPLHAHSRSRRDRGQLRFVTHRDFLRWLSLSEASPNFA